MNTLTTLDCVQWWEEWHLNLSSLNCNTSFNEKSTVVKVLKDRWTAYSCNSYFASHAECAIWAVTWQNKQDGCALSEDSDQTGHPLSLIRVFAVHTKKAWVLSYPLSTQQRLWSDWADAQADLSLHWAHSNFVGFVMSWLIYQILFIYLFCNSVNKHGCMHYCHHSSEPTNNVILLLSSQWMASADQTAWICRLICTFLVRIWHQQVVKWYSSCFEWYLSS